MSEKNQRGNNPSLGLAVWGPLVPSPDCRWGLATLTAVQTAVGLGFWWLPGRNPPRHRSKWTNRGIKLAGVVAGTYLMYTAAWEMIRLAIKVDPWRDQMHAALAESNSAGPATKSLWYSWFGPTNWKPMDSEEWAEKVLGTVNRTAIQISAGGSTRPGGGTTFRLTESAQILRDENRANAKLVLETLKEVPERAPSAEESKKLKEWEVHEPWQQLLDETEIYIRLVPHSWGTAEADDISQLLPDETGVSALEKKLVREPSAATDSKSHEDKGDAKDLSNEK